jgi:hypothetical protein
LLPLVLAICNIQNANVSATALASRVTGEIDAMH